MIFRLQRSRFVASAAGAGLTCLIPSMVKAEFEWKLGHSWPVEFSTHISLAEMAGAVKTESRGRLQIQVFPNNALGSQSSMFSQLRLGSIQMYAANHSVYSSVVPVSQISGVGYAFSSTKQALEVMDGPLGAYIRKEFVAKGMYVFDRSYDNEFRQTTSSTKPIRTVEDFAGFKIRVIPAAIFVDLFKALGASPVPLDASEIYTALQTHIVDGQETGIAFIESAKLYEVQKYLCITNHIWGGGWLVANLQQWNALPPDLQEIFKRNAAKYALAQRHDIGVLESASLDKLKRQGMAVNTTDPAGIRPRLAAYFAHWRDEFGPTAWSMLEAKVGKLG